MKPKISFTFPIRWLKDEEDRKYLHVNLAKMAGGSNNKQIVGNELKAALAANNPYNFIPAFTVRIKTHAYRPQSYKFTPQDAQKSFKNILPGAKCMTIDKRFVQTNDPNMLPVMEMEIYY